MSLLNRYINIRNRQYYMLAFTSPHFLPVLICVLVSWYLLPNKIKKLPLLLFSYYYAWDMGGMWTVVVLAGVTLLTYIWGFLLSKSKNKKFLLFLYIFILLLLLIYGRQSTVLIQLLTNVTGNENITWTVVSMVGLSYYVLSAVSYMADIYRGTDEVERNLLDAALWFSFFAKFTSGPIERHKDFKMQLLNLPLLRFDPERIKRGLLICARGYFYKIVIANRITLFVDSVIPQISDNFGFTLLITMFLCALDVYFDFAGYSLIALGVSHAMGIKVTNNFNFPLFSASIGELWTRWHISLSRWLRDYIYIPLGGSRKGKLRKYLNLTVTFIVSGIWHGAGIMYLLWGALNAFYQILEDAFLSKIKLPRGIKIFGTLLLFGFEAIIFKADSLQTVKIFIKRLFTSWNPEIFVNGTLTGFGLDAKDWCVLLPALFMVLVMEILQYKGVSLYAGLQKRNIVIRWIVYFLIIFGLEIFGMYGPSFDVSSFIYLQF